MTADSPTRIQSSPSSRYRVSDLQVDVGTRRVTRNGEDLGVGGLSFDLLMTLLHAAPNLVSIDELMRRVWPGLVVGTEAVSQRVMVLRRTLKDEADAPRYVEGVRGHGYRLLGPVELLPPTDRDSLTESPEPASSVSGRGRRFTVLAAAVGFMIIGAIGITVWRANSGQRMKAIQPALIPAAGTVAVLPFANLTGDASKDYLGDGMADELINALSKVPGLKIPARTSSFAYRGRNTDIRQIAKDLGVATILEGSVRTAGERIRITAQLVNARDGLHLWSESYDRNFTDLFQLQDELATAIVNALQIKLDNSGLESVVRAHPTQDIVAYELYLRGWALVDRISEQHENRAIQYFQQAIARDPSFARAYDSIAAAHMDLAASLGVQPFDNFAKAERAAQQALALDPTIADAHNALAGVNIFRRNWLESAAHSRAAMTLDPNDGYTRIIRAIHLLYAGHTREALDQASKAMELAPANPFVIAYAAMANAQADRRVESQKLASLAEELGYPKDSEPLPTLAMYAALSEGRYQDAATLIMMTSRVSSLNAPQLVEAVNVVFAALENPARRPEALAAADKLQSAGRFAQTDATLTDLSACLASSYVYALLEIPGQSHALALQCLDHTAPGSVFTGNAGLYLWMPALRHFRRDPHFQAFASRMGLMEYYQQYGPPDDCDLTNGKLSCH